MNEVILEDTSKQVVYNPPRIGWVRNDVGDEWKKAVVFGIKREDVLFRVVASINYVKEFENGCKTKDDVLLEIGRGKWKMLTFDNPYEVKKWERFEDVPNHLWGNAWVKNRESSNFCAKIMDPYITTDSSGKIYKDFVWCPMGENLATANWREMEGDGK